MQQALDFLEESDDLDRLIADLNDQDYERSTGFKQWTINDVLQHLHFWNHAALLSLQDPEGFKAFFEPIGVHMAQGKDLKSYERLYFSGLSVRQLVSQWRTTFQDVAEAFEQADPAQRVAWVGPSMSARSSITARQMETWAHGQAVYDELGVDRVDSDRIRNIVVLGINTYGWTFINRKQSVPDPMPYVSLIAPSGDNWTYGEPQDDNCIEGSASAFAQVVTQTRHVSDTDIVYRGSHAEQWMLQAQCFAGAPNPVPEPGSRRKQ